MSEDARARVAARLRQLSEVLATADDDPAAWRGLEESLTSALAVAPPAVAGPSRYARNRRDDPAEVLVGHPLFEGAAAVHPPVRCTVDGDRLDALVTFDASWEGPAGTVHGGFLAATFDLVLSQLAVAALGRCVTRSLRLRYLRRVPVGAEVSLSATAGTPEGRLLEVTGTASVDGRVATRAIAQFATLGPGR